MEGEAFRKKSSSTQSSWSTSHSSVCHAWRRVTGNSWHIDWGRGEENIWRENVSSVIQRIAQYIDSIIIIVNNIYLFTVHFEIHIRSLSFAETNLQRSTEAPRQKLYLYVPDLISYDIMSNLGETNTAHNCWLFYVTTSTKWQPNREQFEWCFTWRKSNLIFAPKTQLLNHVSRNRLSQDIVLKTIKTDKVRWHFHQIHPRRKEGEHQR